MEQFTISMERTITDPADRAARLKRLHELVKKGRRSLGEMLRLAKADFLALGPAYEDDWRHKNR